MKKIFASLAVVVAAFVFSGCGTKKAAEVPVKKESPAETKNGGVISSIKDAIGLGSKIQCTTTSNDGTTSVAFVEGKKFKSTSQISGKKQNVIFDGETSYMWTDGEATGLKMAMTCLADLKSSLPQEQQNLVNDSIPKVEDKINSDTSTTCTPVAEIDFTVPSNVVFADQCEVMKKTMDSMKNIKLPQGAKVPANLPKLPK